MDAETDPNPFSRGAASIDGHIMGDDWPGPLSTRIGGRFWAKRAAGWHATAVDCSVA